MKFFNKTLAYLDFTIISLVVGNIILFYVFSKITELDEIIKYIILLCCMMGPIIFLFYYTSFTNSYYKYEIINNQIILSYHALKLNSYKIDINQIISITYSINPLKKRYYSVLFPSEIILILHNGDYIFFQIPDEIFIKIIKNNININIPINEIRQQEYLKIKKSKQ